MPRGRGIGASSPDMRGLPGARMHVGRAAAFGEGGMAGGSVDDGRRIFILEDMTMDQLHDFHVSQSGQFEEGRLYSWIPLRSFQGV